jgi:GWxTD domain-containing protein
MAGYIAERTEKEQWKQIHGTEAKKRFLSQFWFRRDSDPSTPINEERERYMERVRYVNQEYRTAYREGWQTDRGRVYILYGKPDGLERYSSEAETKPYQVWTYDHIEGGVQFYFVDRFGFSNYELVHSTKRDEMHDDQWQRFIKTMN